VLHCQGPTNAHPDRCRFKLVRVAIARTAELSDLLGDQVPGNYSKSRVRQQGSTKRQVNSKATRRGRCMTNVQLSCGGNAGWTKGAHANKPKGSFLESNPFGFICGGFAARERTVMPNAQRLVPSISAGNKDH
jgi:hypothetical protein